MTRHFFIPPAIPIWLRWLFPYKIKPLPIPICNPFSYYLFQNKITLIFINWLFQGMKGMGKTDLIGKICFETFVLIIAYVFLDGVFIFKIITAFFISHTFNWLLNSHFWVFGRYLGITRTKPSRFPRYLKGIIHRLSRNTGIASAIMIGSPSRNEGVKSTSDIDVFLICKEGFINGMNAILYTIKERVLAFFLKFPLDLYLYDCIEMMEKHRKDEIPFVLKDDSGDASAYYRKQGFTVANFEDYEKKAEKAA